MVAVLSVLVVIALSVLLTRIATIALTLTGMSRESARFQARSALTGTGFATRESEAVVNHPVRRQVIMTLMLVGSAGIVTVITTLILSFVGTASVRDATTRLVALLAGLVGLFALATNRRVNHALQAPIHAVLRRYTDLDVRDYAALLHVHGEFAISELLVSADSWLAERSLHDLRLGDEGVLVLGIERAGILGCFDRVHDPENHGLERRRGCGMCCTPWRGRSARTAASTTTSAQVAWGVAGWRVSARTTGPLVLAA